jgi:hypothetical protein
MPSKKIKPKSLYPKQVKQLLQEEKLTLDSELSERLFDDVYSSIDGKIIVVTDNGRGKEYSSREEFLVALQTHEEEQKQEKVVYIQAEKHIQRLIEKPGWNHLDKTQDSSGYYYPAVKAIYTHDDGRFLIWYYHHDGATMYLPGKRVPIPGEKYNCLEDVSLIGEELIAAIPTLIQDLPRLLKIDPQILDKSVASLERIDRAIRHKGKRNCLKPDIFPALIAYFGEVIRQATNGHWEIRSTTDHGEPFDEPWIVVANGNCLRPHVVIDTELYETRFSLEMRAESEIRRLGEPFATYNYDIILPENEYYRFDPDL